MNPDVDGKSLVELLDMLAPALEPDPVSMLPQTWGWVVLCFLLAAGVVFVIYRYRRHRLANAYRRAALVELDDIGDDTAKIAELLRRTALAAYPRETVASLYGQDWLNFLNQAVDNKLFTNPNSQAFLTAPYAGGTSNAEVAKLARDWIKLHKVERRG